MGEQAEKTNETKNKGTREDKLEMEDETQIFTGQKATQVAKTCIRNNNEREFTP